VSLSPPLDGLAASPAEPCVADFTREQLAVLHTRSAALGTALVLCDVVGYVACLVLTVRAESWLGQALSAALATIFVGRLFVLGHDACHQSLTPNRTLSRWLGTSALLASLHPFSLWDLGHNRIHHRYTNQRGLDYVWEPLDPEEYRRLSPWARWKYRAFRTPLGHLAYYGIEIWWRKMFFPRPSEVGGYKREYVWDHVLVSLWALAVPAGLVALRLHWFGAAAGWRDLAATVWWGWSAPILGFYASMSTIIYLHHTHPSVVWMRPDEVPGDFQIAAAAHVVLPAILERTLHQIMDHPAHHLRPGIPLYRLSGGEALLERRHERVLVERWSLAFHLDTLTRCKLFDLRKRAWVPFEDETT
jgi:omega-6 fatty acid desaturase (delta-12 desaturase)